MTNGSLMKAESIAKYFWPVLSDNWSLKPIFGLFESGPFTWFYCIPIEYYNFMILSWNYSQLSFDYLRMHQRNYYNLPNSVFWGRLSMENQPKNPEFKNNPEKFHPCIWVKSLFQNKMYIPSYLYPTKKETHHVELFASQEDHKW